MKFFIMILFSFLLSCSKNLQPNSSDKNVKDKLNNLDITQNKIILKIN